MSQVPVTCVPEVGSACEWGSPQEDLGLFLQDRGGCRAEQVDACHGGPRPRPPRAPPLGNLRLREMLC